MQQSPSKWPKPKVEKKIIREKRHIDDDVSDLIFSRWIYSFAWSPITDHLLRCTFGVHITWSSINNGFHDEHTQNCTFKIKDEATAFKIFVYILSSYCGFCFRCATNIPPVDIEYWTMEMKRNHLLTTQIVLLCTFPLFAFVGCVTRISTASTTFIFWFFIH